MHECNKTIEHEYEAFRSFLSILCSSQVQDMFNPEYYVDEYKPSSDGSWHSLRYHDELETPVPQDSETKIADRKPVVVIPVPGESAWVKGCFENGDSGEGRGTCTSQENLKPSESNKRDRECDTLEENMSMSMANHEDAASSDKLDIHDDASSGNVHNAKRGGSQSKEILGEAGKNSSNSAADCYPGGSCLTYIYESENQSQDDLKLNDVVTVIGIVSFVPELAAVHMEMNDGNADEMMLDDDMLMTHPPTSSVPRLHALVIKKESCMYPAHNHISMGNEISVIRKKIIDGLSSVLGGDELAAEYLLLQLVSRVQSSQQSGQLGSVTGVLPALNLVGCPSNGNEKDVSQNRASAALSPFGASISFLLSSLVPRCRTLSLTVENLNSTPWWPRREPGKIKLLSGPLQLASGTQLLLDETQLSAGTLNEVGLRNLSALQNIMRDQKVAYEFEIFALEQPSDCPVTILSTGKTLLKGVGEVVLPLKPVKALDVSTASIDEAFTTSDVELCRDFLSTARQMTAAIPDSLKEQLEQEMIRAKQTSPYKVSPEVWHRWITLALLLSASYGEGELTMDRWNRIIEMENEREARNAVNAKPIKARK